FIINLAHRRDRLENITKEFGKRNEFDVEVFPAVFRPENGALGLWLTFKKIIEIARDRKLPFVLISEDDHKFTEVYNFKKLHHYIETAESTQADILLGGVSWFDFSTKICEGLHWVNLFNGTQFLIVYDRFYDVILSFERFVENDNLDFVISSLSNKKLVAFPFLSVQKNTGYSDITTGDNERQAIETLFSAASERFIAIESVYKHIKSADCVTSRHYYNEYQLSTYVINTLEREDRLDSIQSQFFGKSEFNLKVLTSPREYNGATGLWRNIKKAVSAAVENDEDLILICEDDHVFSANYDKFILFDSIFQGASLGAELILGGISNYQQGIVATPNLIWVAGFQCTQFTIIFKSMFQKILDVEFLDNDAADLKLSNITSNKYVIHPFVSYQKNFGYSDIPINGVSTENYMEWFKGSESGLNFLRDITEKYIELNNEQ